MFGLGSFMNTPFTLGPSATVSSTSYDSQKNEMFGLGSFMNTPFTVGPSATVSSTSYDSQKNEMFEPSIP